MKNYYSESKVECSEIAASACTTILVGNQVTVDGSFIIARNEDHEAINAKRFNFHPAEDAQLSDFHSIGAMGNDFTYPAAKNALQYTSNSDFDTEGTSFGAAGFNSAGVGITATETIFNNAQVLAIDPYVTKTGIGEDAIVNVILPRVRSAKEGVALLGHIIETQGTAEGFGVAFMDKEGIWYLETGSGHHWMAAKIPTDKYFVSANQGRLVDYIANHPDFMASEGLVEFAQKHHLPSAENSDSFNFHRAYSQDVEHDKTYNYPRVWTLQHMYSDGLKTEIDQGESFPVYLTPKNKLSVYDVMQGLRNHYQATEHDPYSHSNPNDPYRPISVFRTEHSHVLQLRPELPIAIGEIQYIAYGMTALSVYLPFYQGMTSVPEALTLGDNKADSHSAYWKFRKLQTLAMMDWNQFSPIVQQAYHDFEQQTAHKQKLMEAEYIALYTTHPEQAVALINAFEHEVVALALALTEELTNELFTRLTVNVDKLYNFSGA
ncbi:dipeptidase [Photobacterium angustum]|uniref:Dipeptidase n=1 Tax=Photobacterium angustum TaxID=661 RepID=A0A855S6S6_PHOAN|nr:C69 family dipeptidase [Photobacterium angustum]KJF79866.1 peptidase C69 [Photobacterium damselae subsp. damselae]KJG00204.1 peptidase C69 [Photobacterium angustum]KJG27736.1 peptidase C69 [Photobacterium angustum]KJG37606.1 peptidase C69 [Photobacterium angustum]KJG43350.1 peptidase C69 [Photobacterium angustum]